jgi:predicted nucleic acid-binding protein
MKRIFADTSYFIALINRDDQLHDAVVKAQHQLKNAHMVTTDEVLTELLNYCSWRGDQLRDVAVQTVEGLRRDSRVTVEEQSRSTFDGGINLYKSRKDKKYSHPDCVSFELMRRYGITEALTNDHHFKQEGFVVLL